jgi:hypothetical protein
MNILDRKKFGPLFPNPLEEKTELKNFYCPEGHTFFRRVYLWVTSARCPDHGKRAYMPQTTHLPKR